MDSFSTVVRSIAMAGVLALPACDACSPTLEDSPRSDDASRYAEAVCAADDECRCGERDDSDLSCREDARSLFNRLEEDSGFRFSRECFEKVLDFLEDTPCGPASDVPPCLVFTGTREAGAECSSVAVLQFLGLYECKSPLQCDGSVCAPPAQAPVGNYLAPDEECTAVSPPCEPGQYCSSVGVCTSVRGENETCDSPVACGPELFCSQVSRIGDTGTCKIPPGAGEVCEVTTPASCGFQGLLCGRDGRCGDDYTAVCDALDYPGDPFVRSEWMPF